MVEETVQDIPQAQDDTIILLFQNSTKKSVSLADLISSPLAPSDAALLTTNSKKSHIEKIQDVPVKLLIKYVFKTWDAKLLESEVPESIYQIRLIHLGKTLENDLNFKMFDERWKQQKAREEIQEQTQDDTVARKLTHENNDISLEDDYDDDEGLLLGELRLDISDIIHVSLRPVESVKRIKKKNASRNLLNSTVGHSASRISSIKQSKVASGDEDERGSRNGGGCCVIV